MLAIAHLDLLRRHVSVMWRFLVTVFDTGMPLTDDARSILTHSIFTLSSAKRFFNAFYYCIGDFGLVFRGKKKLGFIVVANESRLNQHSRRLRVL